jgi:hypothetical protein
MSDRDKDIDQLFKELEGALCIWARAKGESPQKVYFHEVTPNVRRLLFNDKVFQVIVTIPEDEKPTEEKIG